MTTETTPTDLPDTVSREAHQRMTDERNQARAERDTLAATVKDIGYVDKAREHFTEKGVADPRWAADIALPAVKAAGTEIEDLGTFLDAKFSQLYPSGEAPPPTPEGSTDDGVPTPDAVTPPGFARPSPAAEGTPPGQKSYTINDPEIQALIAANNVSEIQRLDKAGQITWRSAAPTSTPG